MEAEKQGLRLPHIGWNDTLFLTRRPLFEGLREPACFYYVNSYSCVCREPAHLLAEYEYGGRYAAVIGRDNVFGVQFHPEKSHRDGLKLLGNFLAQ